MEEMYDIFGKLGREIESATLVAGRRGIQKYAEQFILNDVISKLELNQADNVLDVGCGLGVLAFPLSLRVKFVVGIDHPNLIARLNNCSIPDNCQFLAGNWLSDHFELGLFDKVVSYSVIHYMANFEEVIIFIQKCLDYLAPGGRLLIADIPNEDKRERFAVTAFGRAFNQILYEKRKLFADNDESRRDELIVNSNPRSSLVFTDQIIFELMSHFRKNGHDTYIYPQKSYLPFGYTREDLVIIKANI